MNISFFKKIIPDFFLSFLRSLRIRSYLLLDGLKPYLNKIKYLNFDVYYSRSNGLINRIRFGNPDRIYERELSEKIVSELSNRNGKVFLDVGANIGLISLYVASKLPTTKIYAFEPGYIQSTLFGITIFANRLDNRVKLYNKALDYSPGLRKFAVHNDINNSGDGFIDTKRGGDIEITEIETTTLDIWWNENKKPLVDVIKIDTEGAELWILKGGIEFIKACRPVIFLEISILNLKNYPHKPLDMYEWFEIQGYELYTVSNIKCSRDNFEKVVSSEDSFFARPKVLK